MATTTTSRRRNVMTSCGLLGVERLTILCRLLAVVLSTVCIANSSTALVKELHYGRGGGLDIECGPDELILIESERLAYSAVGGGAGGRGGAGETEPGSRCRAESASCSVPYSQASWYCRGKSSCSGMQVERRPLHKRTCGSEFTNCLRVEYQCVKREFYRVILSYY